jgi:hypothetical protein
MITAEFVMRTSLASISGTSRLATPAEADWTQRSFFATRNSGRGSPKPK